MDTYKWVINASPEISLEAEPERCSVIGKIQPLCRTKLISGATRNPLIKTVILYSGVQQLKDSFVLPQW